MNPYPRSCIPWFFCRIVVGSVWLWREEFGCELIETRFYLLHKEDIRIILLDEILHLSFVRRRTDAIYVPGDYTHVIHQL